MSIPQIHELRLSFIWTETFPSLLANAAPKAKMAFLGDEKSYEAHYEQIKARVKSLEERKQTETSQLETMYRGDSRKLKKELANLNREIQGQLNDPATLTPPWPWLERNYIHHFWQYYFENTDPNDLSGSQGWEYVVPLRINPPYLVRSPWPKDGPRIRFIMDGLFYPHGLALVIMMRLLFKKPGVGLFWTMERALQVRKDLNFPVILPDESTPVDLQLDALVADIVDYLHKRVFGDEVSPGDRPVQPMTIATFVQGTGGDAALPIVPNSDLHRVLQGLCSWRDDWQNQQNLADLKQVNLLLDDAPAGHMVYHLIRGRAVWMPQYFASTSRRDRFKLSCYHRNLTLVSLQTEMLAQLAVIYSDYLDRGETPPAALESLAKQAVIRLGYLYAALKKGSKKYTYNSASPRFYLEENDYVDIINEVRAAYKLKDLFHKAR